MGYSRWTRSRTAVVVALAAAVSIAAQPACKWERPRPQLYAVALVYSGRVNPAWTVSDSRTATLRQMLAALPANGSPLPPPGTGYSGISVESAALVLDRCFNFRVYRGTIEVQCDAGPRYLVDAGRKVERFLADSGLRQADAAAYNIVIQDLAAAP